MPKVVAQTSWFYSTLLGASSYPGFAKANKRIALIQFVDGMLESPPQFSRFKAAQATFKGLESYS